MQVIVSSKASSMMLSQMSPLGDRGRKRAKYWRQCRLREMNVPSFIFRAPTAPGAGRLFSLARSIRRALGRAAAGRARFDNFNQ
jgi:hypothetical protein